MDPRSADAPADDAVTRPLPRVAGLGPGMPRRSHEIIEVDLFRPVVPPTTGAIPVSGDIAPAAASSGPASSGSASSGPTSPGPGRSGPGTSGPAAPDGGPRPARAPDPSGQDGARGPVVIRGRRVRPGIVVFLLILVGEGLRLYGLGRESLWIDEGYSAYLARLTPVGYVSDVLHTVRNILPPLYFTLLHYWTAAVGVSEVSLRFPSAVAGVLAIPVLYALVARCFDVTAGLLSATALTLSLFHLRYSQEARMYELLALLCVLSLYLLVRLTDERRGWQWVTLALVDTLIVYTHHYGALLLVAEACYLGIRALARDLDRSAVLRWLASRVLFGVLVLPWAVIFLDQVHKVNQYPWLPPVSARSLYDVLVWFAGSSWSLAGFAVLIAVGAVARRGLIGRLRARAGLTREDRGYLLLWCAFAVPVAIAFGYSVLAAPVFGQKYLIASSVAFLALAALGARSLPGRTTGAVALAVVLAACAPQIYRFYHDVSKEQWRESTAWVDAGASPGDLVLFNAGYGRFSGFGVYSRRTDLVTSAFPVGSEEFARMPTAEDLAGLSELTAAHRHVWIVYEQSPDHEATIAQELSRLSVGGDCRQFVGIAACRYDLPAR